MTLTAQDPTAAGQQQTLHAMQILMAAGVPVLLWGDPGTGKTETVERFAADADWHMESIIASLHEPSDFGGLPVRSKDGVTFEPPAWARRVAEHQGDALVFFDEVNTATPATQNALMRVVLNGRVGELDLGPGVRFVAAANPVSQNSAAWDLSAPLANRFAHLQWPITVEEWRIGFLNGWPRPAPLNIEPPKEGDNALRRAKTQIAAFVSSRPSLLSDVPDAETAASLAWPSSRSWDRLAVCETLCAALHADDGVRLHVAAALVGQGPAVEYSAYISDLDLPDPLDVLADPASIRLIERSDRKFAALEAVTTAVLAQPETRWSQGFTVCIHAAQADAPDIAAAAATTLMTVKPPGLRLPAGFEVFNDVLTDAGLLSDEPAAA